MSHFRINFHGDEDLERRYIAALQRALDSAKRAKEGEDMNNEPVAWMETKDGKPKALAWVKEALIDAIPLYTHPVKELTDEEIKEMYNEYYVDGEYGYPYFKWLDFTRAILRKAQEKPSSKCGDSYDTVCPPSICDCQVKAQEK